MNDARDTDEDQQMTLRRSDWVHLKGNLTKLHEARPNLSVWCAVFFAVAAAAGASIYPVAVSANLPPVGRAALRLRDPLLRDHRRHPRLARAALRT